MKICWDNLEKLEYTKKGNFRNQGITYYYNDSCKNCGEPFLSQKSEGIFCDNFCKNSGKFNYWYDKHGPMYNKKHSRKSKKKMSEASKGDKNSMYGKKHSMESIEKIRIANMGNDYGKVNYGKNNPNWKGGYRINNIPFYDTYAHQIDFCEDIRRNKEDQNVLEVKCAYCGKWYIPTMNNVCNRINALNGKLSNGVENRLYCSDKCKRECPIYKKQKYSAEESQTKQYSREVQPELRQMCFERDKFTCQKCGKTQAELDVGLQCHHVEGIRWEPLESADLDKVITFCKNCHIEVHKQPDCGYHDLRCPE